MKSVGAGDLQLCEEILKRPEADVSVLLSRLLWGFVSFKRIPESG